MEFLRRTRWRRKAAMPAPALPESEPSRGAASLPGLLRRVLSRELCPGEQVARIARPEAPDATSLLRQILWWAVGTPVTFFTFGSDSALPLLWLSAFWLGPQLLHHWLRRRRHRRIAYVVTNQRCFELSLAGFRCRVRDVSNALEARYLPAGEVPEFARNLRELQQASEPGRAERETRATLSLLPQRAREALVGAVTPDEELLWVARPTLLDYVRLAPLDASTFTVGWCAGMAMIVAAVAAASQGTADAIGTPLVALLAGGASAAGWTALVAHLRRRVSRTVYALTNRRGLVVGPGGSVTQFSMAELRRFQRTQAADGGGNLAPGGQAAGFLAVRDVKAIDDLVKGRDTPDRSTELIPAEAQSGRGDEASPAHREYELAPPDHPDAAGLRRRRRRRRAPMG